MLLMVMVVALFLFVNLHSVLPLSIDRFFSFLLIASIPVLFAFNKYVFNYNGSCEL